MFYFKQRTWSRLGYKNPLSVYGKNIHEEAWGIVTREPWTPASLKCVDFSGYTSLEQAGADRKFEISSIF